MVTHPLTALVVSTSTSASGSSAPMSSSNMSSSTSNNVTPSSNLSPSISNNVTVKKGLTDVAWSCKKDGQLTVYPLTSSRKVRSSSDALSRVVRPEIVMRYYAIAARRASSRHSGPSSQREVSVAGAHSQSATARVESPTVNLHSSSVRAHAPQSSVQSQAAYPRPELGYPTTVSTSGTAPGNIYGPLASNHIVPGVEFGRHAIHHLQASGCARPQVGQNAPATGGVTYMHVPSAAVPPPPSLPPPSLGVETSGAYCPSSEVQSSTPICHALNPPQLNVSPIAAQMTPAALLHSLSNPPVHVGSNTCYAPQEAHQDHTHPSTHAHPSTHPQSTTDPHPSTVIGGMPSMAARAPAALVSADGGFVADNHDPASHQAVSIRNSYPEAGYAQSDAGQQICYSQPQIHDSSEVHQLTTIWNVENQWPQVESGVHGFPAVHDAFAS